MLQTPINSILWGNGRIEHFISKSIIIFYWLLSFSLPYIIFFGFVKTGHKKQLKKNGKAIKNEFSYFQGETKLFFIVI